MKVCFYLLLPVWLFAGVQIHSAQTKPNTTPVSTKQAVGSKYGCLPADIKPDTIVDTEQPSSATGVSTLKETVIQRLSKMRARCKAGKMVDQKGKQIRFYQLQTCWGNPPADYLEIVERERNELAVLKKRFTVIEITCNPSGRTPF